jgi:hypothetical protein
MLISNDFEIERTNQILNIYKNYYTKNGKLRKNIKNDFIIHQVDIVKYLLQLSINESHLKIAFIFAKQLI